MEAPIHTEYFRSGGATTLIFMVDGARAVRSLLMRSPTPVNTVVPPRSTMLPYRSFWMSTSQFKMDWKVVSWMQLAFSDEAGLEKHLGATEALAADSNDMPSGSS